MNLTMSEDDWKSRVMDYARLKRWRCCHIRPAKTNKGWRTPIEGDTGLPDLILARDGRVILVELKRVGAYPVPSQKAWLAAAGSNGYLWRPTDWDEVMDVLG